MVFVKNKNFTARVTKSESNKRRFKTNNNKQLELKLFRRRLQRSYSIITGVSARSEQFVCNVRVSMNINIPLLKTGLFRCLSQTHKIDFNVIRSLCPEVGLKTGTARSDLLTVMSSVIVRELIKCAVYYQNNVTTEIDHIRYGLSATRRLPIPFIKFLSFIGLRDQYLSIPDSKNYVFITRGDVVIASKDEIQLITTEIEFFRSLEKLVYIFDIIEPSLNTNFNLYENFPVMESLLSCQHSIESEEILINHSDRIPTEIEACQSYILGLKYDFNGVKPNHIGDEVYAVPIEFEPHLGFKFWEDMLSISDINSVSKLQSFGSDYKTLSNVVVNTPEIITDSKPNGQVQIETRADASVTEPTDK